MFFFTRNLSCAVRVSMKISCHSTVPTSINMSRDYFCSNLTGNIIQIWDVGLMLLFICWHIHWTLPWLLFGTIVRLKWRGRIQYYYFLSWSGVLEIPHAKYTSPAMFPISLKAFSSLLPALKIYYLLSAETAPTFLKLKALANEDFVADTLFLTQMFPLLPAHATNRAQMLCPGHKKWFWFCSETFCVRNKCFPVCAAQEKSRATMCPQQCVLVCQGL